MLGGYVEESIVDAFAVHAFLHDYNEMVRSTFIVAIA